MDKLKKIKQFENLIDLYLLYLRYKRRRKIKHAAIVPPVLVSSRVKQRKKICRYRGREVHSYFAKTFLKIKEHDGEAFFQHTRMTKQTFDFLLNLCTPYLEKHSIREAISPENRLALTLYYLAQGCNFQTLSDDWLLGKETVRKILYETCEAIWNVLTPVHVKEPTTSSLEAVAADYWKKCKMPNCLGSVAGKVIAIGRAQKLVMRSDCIILLAACDVNFNFTYVDVGSYGAPNSPDVFVSSNFGQRLLNQELLLPTPQQLPHSEVILPHYFVSDSTFPIHPNIMRSYHRPDITEEQSLYNGHISRVNRYIENACGILAARWRVLNTSLCMRTENADKIVKACVVLHNFLLKGKNTKSLYMPAQYADWEENEEVLHNGMWRQEIDNPLQPIAMTNIHHPKEQKAMQIREQLCMFINNYDHL